MIKNTCETCKHGPKSSREEPCHECTDINLAGNGAFTMWEPKNHAVSAQPHYTEQGVQPIELMVKNFTKEQFIGYLKGNIIKYVLRADKKNGTEDYAKASVYASWLKEYTETGKITIEGKGQVGP